VHRTEEKLRNDVEGWSFALADLSRLVADPTLKRELAAASKDVASLKGDVHKINNARVAALRAQVEKVCAGR
jgi:hypothetical protein